MPQRTSPTRMTSNYMDRTLETPKWIKRMSINDRLNYITRMYSETCGDNWYLWIETAIEGLPKLVYSLLAISKVDVIKEVLEHKYGCGLRQAIGSGKNAPRTAAQKAKFFFWKIEGVRGRLFWYWLIIESVTAYVIEWQSIVIREQRCEHPPHAGPCILDSPGSTLGSIVGTTTLFYSTREYDPSQWSGTAGNPTVIAPTAIGTYNVGCSVTCVWGSDNDITWHCDILDGLSNVVATSNSVTGKASAPTTASCFGVSSALGIGTAQYRSRVVVTASPGATFGHCLSGTFSVGLQQ
jgi:hypothetical protein